MATVTYEQTQRDSGPARAKPSRRRVAVWFVIVALLLALVGGGLFAFDRFRSKAIADFFASQVPPPTPVAAEPARVGPMPRYLDGIGTLTAVREVQVSPELAGRVETIAFEPGATVEAGAPLVQLNDAPEQADLATYQSNEKLALANLARTQQLVRRDFATQATMDQNQQALEEARAGIARSRAIIDQKPIKAPFAGELGLRRCSSASMSEPGDTLVTLTDLTNLYATFTLPERDRSAVAVGQPVELRADAYPGEVFKGDIYRDRATGRPRHAGDAGAGDAAQSRAAASCPACSSTPASCCAPVADVVSVPETAVTSTLYGDSVFIVSRGRQGRRGQAGAQGGADLRQDRASFDGRLADHRGVSAGDVVVSSGQLKLQNGSPVSVAADAPPPPAQTPGPGASGRCGSPTSSSAGRSSPPSSAC